MARAYVGEMPLKLLLLLSALLSALTGAVAGQGMTSAPVALSRAASAQVAAARTAPAMYGRPAALRLRPVDTLADNGLAAVSFVPAEPAYANRRRE